MVPGSTGRTVFVPPRATGCRPGRRMNMPSAFICTRRSRPIASRTAMARSCFCRTRRCGRSTRPPRRWKSRKACFWRAPRGRAARCRSSSTTGRGRDRGSDGASAIRRRIPPVRAGVARRNRNCRSSAQGVVHRRVLPTCNTPPADDFCAIPSLRRNPVIAGSGSCGARADPGRGRAGRGDACGTKTPTIPGSSIRTGGARTRCLWMPRAPVHRPVHLPPPHVLAPCPGPVPRHGRNVMGETMSEPRRITRALLSVSDKSGLVDLARALTNYGVELVSTGGTARALKEAGLPVVAVSDQTGFPAILDGRVKTLHPKVHGGLLAVRGNPEHMTTLRRHGIEPIDLLVVNLYPFEATLERGAALADCVENIDIGGPAMIRAAAKNHADVTVVVEPADYERVLGDIEQHGGTTLALRQKLAAKAYARTAAYDAAISNWFAATLRYGENPHQSAAFYRTPEKRFGVATARQVQGKQLSYNNINDTDAAYECVAEFDPARTAACVIVKHANPCGVAEGESLLEAYRKALACDTTSAFGGIVALNRTLDADAARAITEIFTEVIVAPDATDEAIAIVGAKKNLRLLLAGGLPDPRASGLTAKTVAGGLLVQSRDNAVVDDMDLRPVTKRAPSNAELRDLRFAFRVAKHVKSNTIVYAKDLATVGIGAGQIGRAHV